MLRSVVDDTLGNRSGRGAACGSRCSDRAHERVVDPAVPIFEQALGEICLKEGKVLQHLTAHFSVTGHERNGGIHHRHIVVDLGLGTAFCLRSERTFTDGGVPAGEGHVAGGSGYDSENVVKVRREERAQDGIVGVADLRGAGQVVTEGHRAYILRGGESTLTLDGIEVAGDDVDDAGLQRLLTVTTKSISFHLRLDLAIGGDQSVDLLAQFAESFALLLRIFIQLRNSGSMLYFHGSDFCAHLGFDFSELRIERADDVFYFHFGTIVIIV